MSVLPDHVIEELSWLSDGDRYVHGEPPLIDPFNQSQLQPASYDTLLDHKLLIPERSRGTKPSGPVDLHRGDAMRFNELRMDVRGYCLYPGSFILGATMEWVNIPDHFVGRIEGKSSLARVGIQIHSAGYLDPGFRGNVTLEIVNFFPRPVIIWPGMKIAQLSFDEMASPCRRAYGSPGLGSHYQDARGVEGSRYGSEVT